MIEEIEIRNFQSLHHVKLELAPFTAIIGPSSSGKSALTRAARVLIENQRGSAFISHGERVSSITAKTSNGVVTLTRGKGTDDNSYVVIPNDPSHKLAPQTTFTKLGGETPVEVSQFLGIDPKDPIAFAGQFDKPYLLDERPAEIARVLGELTNVRVIFDAARESNRRKLASSQLMKTRQADLAEIKARVPEFRAIKEQVSALDAAADLISEAQEIEEQISELEEALDGYEIAISRIEQLRPLTQVEIPDESELIEAYEELRQFQRDMVELVQAVKAHEAAIETRYRATLEYDELGEHEEKIRSALSGELADYMLAESNTITHDGNDATLIELNEAAALAQRWFEERG